MPLARKSPSEIAIYTRLYSRRAIAGLASCVATLLGVNTAVTYALAGQVEAAQELANTILQPKTPRTASPPTPSAAVSATPALRSQEIPSQPTGPDTTFPWSTLGATAVISYTAFVGLGLANRRSLQRDAEGHDIATEHDYSLYGFEKQQIREQSRDTAIVETYEAAVENTDQRTQDVEQAVNETLMTARLRSPLNSLHVMVLDGQDQDPLQALTYRA